MGMTGFTPRQISEALQYLYQHGDETTIIAGGTDILVRFHRRMDELKRIMNIWNLEELKEIKITDDEIEVGSLVTHTQLEKSAIILNHVPFLAEAASEVGSPQIRNRGTIGGNVANSSPAGDTIPALMVLDAKVKLISLERGERVVSINDFFLGPGRNLIKKDELIYSFIFTIPHENYRGKFLKLGLRKALSISTVNGAILVTMKDGLINECRIALGAVAPTPVRVKLTEEGLKGKKATKEIIENAVNFLSQEISPISDIRGSRQYRLDVAKELVKRELLNILL